jgi:hypothetical protein
LRDDEVVVVVDERVEDPPESARVGLGVGHEIRLAGDDPEPVWALDHRVEGGGLPCEDRVERRAVGRDAEHPGEVRHPQVGVDDRDPVAGGGERDAQVRRRGRLADPAFRARYRVHPSHTL